MVDFGCRCSDVGLELAEPCLILLSSVIVLYYYSCEYASAIPMILVL